MIAQDSLSTVHSLNEHGICNRFAIYIYASDRFDSISSDYMVWSYRKMFNVLDMMFKEGFFLLKDGTPLQLAPILDTDATCKCGVSVMATISQGTCNEILSFT